LEEDFLSEGGLLDGFVREGVLLDRFEGTFRAAFELAAGFTLLVGFESLDVLFDEARLEDLPAITLIPVSCWTYEQFVRRPILVHISKSIYFLHDLCLRGL
jgi:hypothetical protein